MTSIHLFLTILLISLRSSEQCLGGCGIGGLGLGCGGFGGFSPFGLGGGIGYPGICGAYGSGLGCGCGIPMCGGGFGCGAMAAPFCCSPYFGGGFIGKRSIRMTTVKERRDFRLAKIRRTQMTTQHYRRLF
ncbi:hypothetical protein M3Y98_00757100 [Aphelenchoides besseyi]|nr:hypothetical protein M3Y98_00757100 [Aphelenchoides besseyi]KAI6211613.1 hypothetical protein M3Y96_00452800 [Aphelenchoides besseyi]